MQGRSGFLWVVLVISQMDSQATAQGVLATVHGDVFRRQQVLAVPVIDGEAGDVAFDPTDGNRLY